MELKANFPAPAKRAVRDTYVRVGMLSASKRLEPDFILIGGQRCGTTSLFRAFERHPQIVRPTFNKGINYFDLNYHRGRRWYQAHFPLERVAKRNSPKGSSLRTFEASGYYIFHPQAPARIARDLPNVKIIAMLRDPIERAYSAWKHESARGFDDVSFEEAIQSEEDRTRGERHRMMSDPSYESFAYRHYSYVARGNYAVQLREYYDRFPSDSIHIIYSESLFLDPDGELARLAEFLDVERFSGTGFDQHNARPSGPMPGRSREILEGLYAGQSDQLEALVGLRPPWATQSPGCSQ